LRIGYRPFSVVANEIMYAPSGTEPEWVELFNTRGDTINLKDWFVSDNVVTARKLISSSVVFVPPGGYVVLTKDSAALVDIHPEIPSRVVNVSAFPTLNNSGDAVVLYDNRLATMDSVSYTPGWGGNSGGRSLERIDPLARSTTQANWNSSRHPNRSTPGRRNSITRKDHDLALDTVMALPAFPVRGDSIIVTTKIRNQGYQPASMFTLRLYDDFDNDSLAQPTELVSSLVYPGTLPPLDSIVLGLPPFRLTRNDHRLIAQVSFVQDEDSLNNTAYARVRVGHRRGSVVINEIMYSPIGEPEWFELHNSSAESVDVKDWMVSNRQISSRYILATFSAVLPPFGYAVFTKDTALLLQRYVRLPGLVVQAFSLPTFLFSNSGDAVVVFDNRDLQMDSVRYLPAWGGIGGTSLERIDPLDVSNDSANWSSSSDSMSATPGRENSQASLDHDLRALKSAAISGPPRAPVNLGVTVKNVGRMVGSDFDVAFFDDSNRDSLAAPAELIARVHIAQSLSRRETLRVSSQWPDPAGGIHNVIANVEYVPDLRPSNNSTVFAVKVGYEPRVAVVNEIMFAPFTNEAEYVELLNVSASDIDVGGWKLLDRPGASGGANEVDIPPGPRIVHSGEYFVIASDSTILFRFPGLDSLGARMITIARQSSLNLNNDGDDVVVKDASGTTVDSVAYLPSWHNRNIADPTGRALEKIYPSLASNDPRNWSTCAFGVGGTPGKRNSIYTAALPSQAKVSTSPNPFSPDGDGVEDFTVIHYELPTEVAMVGVKIYDVRGRRIRHLASNEHSGSIRDIVWDGLDDDGQKARVGIYVVLVEGLNETGGSVYSAKGVVVVAAKL
ncbi:MAG: lamin tail domain-containing protein, partial [Bacteroidota bacterium]